MDLQHHLWTDQELVLRSELAGIETCDQQILSKGARGLAGNAVLSECLVVFREEQAHSTVRASMTGVPVGVPLEPELGDLRSLYRVLGYAPWPQADGDQLGRTSSC